MRPETLDKLNFDHVRGRLASFCACGLGKRLAAIIRPSSESQTVRAWLTQAREFAEAADEIGPPPFGGIHDVREDVRATAQPAPLEADALARIADTLKASGLIADWFGTLGVRAPSLHALAARMGEFGELVRAIQDCIDGRGSILDHASPKLRSIRRTIEDAHERINVMFDRMLRHASTVRLLQYAGTTFHNDRVVLPLRAEHRGRIPGIIHRSSDSGATLFVEPAEVVELNNTIIQLKEEEHKEVTRILRELTRLVHQQAPAILATLQAVGVLDLNRAKWAYARHHQCCYPVIDDEGRLNLIDARHPVLLDLFAGEEPREGARRQVVPIDVRLGADFDALVITGPNTGGKTVAIKTVGLLVLMAQAGVPIPAAPGSCLPVYRNIFVDIGDEQSIQQSLSTFSSHLSNLLDIVRKSGARTLVLIDELGAGTDPDEGAAIGRALVEELLSLGASVIVTTHLSALKAMAYTTPRVDNASVEFDAATLRPAFRLLLGEPGNSNALVIAERLGMPARVAQRARAHLDDRHRNLDRAIRGTLHSRRQAEEALKTARQAALDAERAKGEFERKQRELDSARAKHETWSRWLNTLRPGETVHVRSFESNGKLVRLQLHKQSAVVAVGAFEMEVSLSDLASAVD